MKLRNLLRLAGILGVAAPLLATGAPPASATEAGSIVFVGRANVTCPGNGGLGYPITMKTQGTVPTLKSGKNCTWNFFSTTCVAFGLTVNKPGKSTVQTSLACTITALGNLTGYCGLSSGTGTGAVVIGNQTYTLKNLGFTGAGGTLLVHAGVLKNNDAANKGVAEAVVEAVPLDLQNPPPGNSCTNNTASVFTIAGTAAFAIITA